MNTRRVKMELRNPANKVWNRINRISKIFENKIRVKNEGNGEQQLALQNKEHELRDNIHSAKLIFAHLVSKFFFKFNL